MSTGSSAEGSTFRDAASTLGAGGGDPRPVDAAANACAGSTRSRRGAAPRARDGRHRRPVCPAARDFDYSRRRETIRSRGRDRCASQFHLHAVSTRRAGRSRRRSSRSLRWRRPRWPPIRRQTLRVAMTSAEGSLRSAGLRRRGLRRHHRPHLRFDAGLRLPGAAGEARAADARGDADDRRRRRDLRFQAEARESSSRRIRRSRAGRANSPPATRRTRSGACSIPR